MVVLQKQRSQLTTEIQSETDKLLEERKKVLQEASSEIEKKIIEAELELTSFEELIALAKVTFTEVTKENKSLYSTNEKLNNELAAQRIELSKLKESVITSVADLRSAETSRNAIENSISHLTEDKTTLENLIKDQKNTLETLEKSIPNLEEELKIKQSEIKEKLTLLEQEFIQKTQDLDQLGKNEQTVRENLAQRDVLLQERDKNLRIREMKVEEGENKLLANANLLQL